MPNYLVNQFDLCTNELFRLIARKTNFQPIFSVYRNKMSFLFVKIWNWIRGSQSVQKSRRVRNDEKYTLNYLWKKNIEKNCKLANK